MINGGLIKSNQVINGSSLKLESGSLVLHGNSCITRLSLRTRGFETIKGHEAIPLPVRATRDSAGYDIASSVDIVIPPGKIVMVPTGLKAYMGFREWLGVYLRSSVAKKLNLSMANAVAVIDRDYYNNPSNEGHIHVMIKNNTSGNVLIQAGQRIAQGIFQKCLLCDDDNVTTERTGGTGSTGK